MLQKLGIALLASIALLVYFVAPFFVVAYIDNIWGLALAAFLWIFPPIAFVVVTDF